MKAIQLFYLLFTLSSICKAQFAYRYDIYTANENYYLTSIPYYHQIWTSLGITKVYQKSDNKELYCLPRYFAPHQVYINSKGNVICELVFDYNDGVLADQPVLRFYQQGLLFKTYTIKDLHLDYSSVENGWLYSTFDRGGVEDTIKIHQYRMLVFKDYEADSLEKWMDEFSMSSNGDTLQLITNDQQLIWLDLNTGSLLGQESAYQYLKYNKLVVDSRRIDEQKIDYELQYGFPNLSTSVPLGQALAKQLGLTEFKITDDSPKHYLLVSISSLVDKQGKCQDLEIEIQEDKQGKRQLIKKGAWMEKIKYFMASNIFETKYHPPGADKFLFNDMVMLKIK